MQDEEQEERDEIDKVSRGYTESGHLITDARFEWCDLKKKTVAGHGS